MLEAMRLPVFGLSAVLLFINQAFADGVLFTCTGTNGHAIRAPAKSFVAKSKEPEITSLPINDAARTVKLWVRSNHQWDISLHTKDLSRSEERRVGKECR